jgi:hypothetical protein
MELGMIEKKLKKRILAFVIDFWFCVILLGKSLLFKYYVALIFLSICLAVVYLYGYTVGGLLTKQKIYWKEKKDFISFIKRTIVAIFYNFFIFPYKFSEIEYSLNGEYSYDLEFGTYVGNHKEYKSEYKLTKIKKFAFYWKWFIVYVFLVLLIFVVIFSIFGAIWSWK